MLDSGVCHATQKTEGNHESLGGGKVICRPTLENGHRTTGPIGYNFEVLLAAPKQCHASEVYASQLFWGFHMFTQQL